MVPSFLLGPLSVLLVYVSLVQGDFTPPGEFDLGPDDLDKLCPMVNSLAQTGKVDENAGMSRSGGPCNWFKWVSCEKPGDPNIPCGWYEQQRCPSRKKRMAMKNSSRFNEDNSDSIFRKKRESENQGPFFLAFPDEHPHLKYTEHF